MPPIRLLLLDVEGTLISNVVSCFPRPRLSEFLESVRGMADRIALYSSASVDRVRQVVRVLVAEGSMPEWMTDIEVHHAADGSKPLDGFGVPLHDLVLLDDMPTCPDAHRHRWVPVPPFEPPFTQQEDGLLTALDALQRGFIGKLDDIR